MNTPYCVRARIIVNGMNCDSQAFATREEASNSVLDKILSAKIVGFTEYYKDQNGLIVEKYVPVQSEAV